MQVVRYADENRSEWDEFVDRSKNGTFLFRRGYLEYHADRFPDASLVVRDEKANLVALLPATSSGSTVSSHAGLTYGGLVTDGSMTAARMLETFEALTAQLTEAGHSLLEYKTVPHIYHRVPAEEDRYALWRAGARLARRDVLLVVDYRERVVYQERRRRAIRKASDAAVTVRRTHELSGFWAILESTLRGRHGVDPVHSLAEIELLRSRFPERIELHVAERGGAVLAGVLAFITSTVCHLQYIASSPEGREIGALDLVVDHLIEAHSERVRYFDFGATTEDAGRQLNEGLADQKEGFGARTVVHDHYELALGG